MTKTDLEKIDVGHINSLMDEYCECSAVFREILNESLTFNVGSHIKAIGAGCDYIGANILFLLSKNVKHEVVISEVFFQSWHLRSLLEVLMREVNASWLLICTGVTVISPEPADTQSELFSALNRAYVVVVEVSDILREANQNKEESK